MDRVVSVACNLAAEGIARTLALAERGSVAPDGDCGSRQGLSVECRLASSVARSDTPRAARAVQVFRSSRLHSCSPWVAAYSDRLDAFASLVRAREDSPADSDPIAFARLQATRRQLTVSGRVLRMPDCRPSPIVLAERLEASLALESTSAQV
jgi:hypothetical protein